MPNYTLEGKIQQPLTESDFKEGMEQGYFVRPRHRAYCILLYYSAVRKMEGLSATRDQFHFDNKNIYFNVIRLDLVKPYACG